MASPQTPGQYYSFDTCEQLAPSLMNDGLKSGASIVKHILKTLLKYNDGFCFMMIFRSPVYCRLILVSI